MTQNPYNQPPITEAVIQIKFIRTPEESKVDKFIKKLKEVYEDYQESTSYTLGIGIDTSEQDKPKTETTSELVHRFSSEDMTQQMILNKSSILVSQLAPYGGWDDFMDRFMRDWKLWKKYLGFNEIKQIGVRYLNRIDIPVTDATLEFSEYVNVYPTMPDILDPQLSYAIQAKVPINDLKSVLTFNSAVVESPLLNHMSLVIDQDIVKTFDVPQKDELIYDFLNDVRTKKNLIFESCITNKAREIFNT